MSHSRRLISYLNIHISIWLWAPNIEKYPRATAIAEFVARPDHHCLSATADGQDI